MPMPMAVLLLLPGPGAPQILFVCLYTGITSIYRRLIFRHVQHMIVKEDIIKK